MSEYWKSTPKYWCKHCSTYVKDTPFERKQHESTGKHQGNLKRFLRGIQNDHERGEREKEKAKAEVDRLNKVVGGQPSPGGPSATKPSTIRKATNSAPAAVDQKRQWAQLAEMGIQVPDNFRAEMAMPGQWQTTSRPIIDSSTPEDSLSKGVRKRKLEGEEEEEESTDTGKRRGWGTMTRRYPEQHDLGLDALLSAAVVKKEATPESKPKSEAQDPDVSEAEAEELSGKMGIMSKQPEAETEDKLVPGNTALAVDQADIKSENEGLDGQTILTNVSEESTAPVFKKRKSKLKAGKGS